VTCHVQWCGLSRAHAATITEYPELEQMLKLGNKLSDFWWVSALARLFAGGLGLTMFRGRPAGARTSGSWARS
jgi:hypothetical protein